MFSLSVWNVFFWLLREENEKFQIFKCVQGKLKLTSYVKIVSLDF
jgi:hypothetical protein